VSVICRNGLRQSSPEGTIVGKMSTSACMQCQRKSRHMTHHLGTMLAVHSEHHGHEFMHETQKNEVAEKSCRHHAFGILKSMSNFDELAIL